MNHIAIDLGATAMRIYIKDKEIYTEPAIVAVDSLTEKVVATGKDAEKMIGRVGKNIQFYRPFSMGLVKDSSFAEYFITSYIKKHSLGKFFLPEVTLAVPESTTKVEREAITKVFNRSGIRKVTYNNRLVTAFIGTSHNIKSSVGIMTAGIGYESGFCGVFAKGQRVNSGPILYGGKHFNDALIRYVRIKHEIEIGPQTAEFAKREIGCASARERMISCHIRGKDIHTDLPKDVIITSEETREAFEDICAGIALDIEKVTELLPPEIYGDIVRAGMVISGGGAALHGLDRYLERRLKFPVMLCDKPDRAMLRGLALKSV